MITAPAVLNPAEDVTLVIVFGIPGEVHGTELFDHAPDAAFYASVPHGRAAHVGRIGDSGVHVAITTSARTLIESVDVMQGRYEEPRFDWPVTRDYRAWRGQVNGGPAADITPPF